MTSKFLFKMKTITIFQNFTRYISSPCNPIAQEKNYYGAEYMYM